MTIRNLEYLFKPRSIAVVGRGKAIGSPDAILEFNLIEGGFKGPVMPVNPDQRSISGVLAYKDIASLPVTPDLAVLTTPLDEAPTLIGELGSRGTKAALLISRDVLLFLGAVIVQAIGGHVEIRPRIVGKVATFFQMLTIVWVLAAWSPRCFIGTVGPAFLFTAISALWYLVDGVKQLEKAALHHAQHPTSHA